MEEEPLVLSRTLITANAGHSQPVSEVQSRQQSSTVHLPITSAKEINTAMQTLQEPGSAAGAISESFAPGKLPPDLIHTSKANPAPRVGSRETSAGDLETPGTQTAQLRMQSQWLVSGTESLHRMETPKAEVLRLNAPQSGDDVKIIKQRGTASHAGKTRPVAQY